jgi:uncharacterized membrane protein YgdD (TMEM256/DUF423 family)
MRVFLVVAAVNGFLAVLLGAFGAHGLKARFALLPDAAERLDWWRTAANYHLAHALALGLVALVAARAPSLSVTLAGWAFAAGVLLFSGSLYALSFTGTRVLGAVTPFGGLLLLAGWACLTWAALTSGKN